MKAESERGVLYLVPETNIVADRVDELRSYFLERMRENREDRKIVLDMRGVNIVDSLGMNLIIGLYREAVSAAGELKIINAGEKFMKIANFFRLPSIIPVEGSERS